MLKNAYLSNFSLRYLFKVRFKRVINNNFSGKKKNKMNIYTYIWCEEKEDRETPTLQQYIVFSPTFCVYSFFYFYFYRNCLIVDILFALVGSSIFYFLIQPHFYIFRSTNQPKYCVPTCSNQVINKKVQQVTW